VSVKINLEDLFEYQVKTHKCKKDLRCDICGAECCELCAVFTYDFEKGRFVTICYKCSKEQNK